MEKYSKREKRRVNDMLPKITTSMVRESAKENVTFILEKLDDLSYNTATNYAKRKNRKV